MISELPENEQQIITEALVANLLDKKIIVVCPDNETKQKLLKVVQAFRIESSIEIQVPPKGMGKRAEAVIIDWVVFEEEKPQ